MVAPGNKLSVTDIVYMLAMGFTCTALLILHFNYINIVCVIDILLCVFSVCIIMARIFLLKVDWFVIAKGKRLLIYNLKFIEGLKKAVQDEK